MTGNIRDTEELEIRRRWVDCFHGGWVFHKSSFFSEALPPGGGGGGRLLLIRQDKTMTYNDLYEVAPSERGPFSLVAVYERGGNLM